MALNMNLCQHSFFSIRLLYRTSIVCIVSSNLMGNIALVRCRSGSCHMVHLCWIIEAQERGCGQRKLSIATSFFLTHGQCVLRNTEISEICDFAMGPTTFHILIQEPSKMSLLLKCVLGICQRWCCVHVEMNSRKVRSEWTHHFR